MPAGARGAHQVIALRKTCESDSCRYDDSAGTDMMSGPSDSLRARARRRPAGPPAPCTCRCTAQACQHVCPHTGYHTLRD